MEDNNFFDFLNKSGFYISKDKKDYSEHSCKVADYTQEIAKLLNTQDSCNRLFYAGLLHDIGKSSVCIQSIYPNKEDFKNCDDNDLHPITGALFVTSPNTIIYKELIKRGLSDEYIALIGDWIKDHKECISNNKESCILAAADKLAHYEKLGFDKVRAKLQKIKNIEVEDVAQSILERLLSNEIKNEYIKKYFCQ